MGEVIRKTHKGKFVGWYLRYVDCDGQRKQRASHQPTAALARKMLVEIEARIARGKSGMNEVGETDMTFSQLFEQFIARYSSPRVKDLTRYKARLTTLIHRVQHCALQMMRVRVSELRPTHIARIRDAVARRYSNGTVRHTLSGLGAVFTWAVREGLIDRHPARGVEQPPSPPRLDEWLDAEEVRRLLVEAERRGLSSRVWRVRHVAIALGVYLGLRRGEIFGLRWRDVDLERGRVAIARSYSTTPKSGKTRHLKLPQPLGSLLKEWRPHCPITDEGVVCPVQERHGKWQLSHNTNHPRGLPTLLKAAGCKQLTRPWHGLRHSFASNFLAAGGSLLALQRILGHSEVRTTMVYAHLSDEFIDVEIERLKY